MNISELQGWLTLLLSAAVICGGLIAFYFKMATHGAKEVYQAEKREVLNSLASMMKVMEKFDNVQKETDRSVNDLKMSLLEVKVQIATHKELLERFFREMVIDTGDGFKIDPRKANKQR